MCCKQCAHVRSISNMRRIGTPPTIIYYPNHCPSLSIFSKNTIFIFVRLRDTRVEQTCAQTKYKEKLQFSLSYETSMLYKDQLFCITIKPQLFTNLLIYFCGKLNVRMTAVLYCSYFSNIQFLTKRVKLAAVVCWSLAAFRMICESDACANCSCYVVEIPHATDIAAIHLVYQSEQDHQWHNIKGWYLTFKHRQYIIVSAAFPFTHHEWQY